MHDGAGIRPAATGFDRVITLGDMDWTDYEVTAEDDLQLLRHLAADRRVGGRASPSAGRGTRTWGQPRFGHPSGGLCLYSCNANDPLSYRLQLGYSPGPAHDTVVRLAER